VLEQQPGDSDGIVPMTSSHASRSSGAWARRVESVWKNAFTIRAQSFRKYTINAIAVATWRPTRNARNEDSLVDCCVTTWLHPKTAGMITLWPRLDTGNSSVMPCRMPMKIA
jgi:hypothetical protein